MEKYGIVGTELAWFKSYLSGRSQVVDINETHSTPRNIDISVIQGKTKGKLIDDVAVYIIFNDNEPNMIENPNLCYPLTRVHDNSPVANGRSYKLLGVYLDEHLNLNHHVSNLCSKLARALF
jgi:hypothetical protein